ncbi:MAG: hypothetical protein AB7G08_23605 [Hyphomicrobiaceae bacterium]
MRTNVVTAADNRDQNAADGKALQLCKEVSFPAREAVAKDLANHARRAANRCWIAGDPQHFSIVHVGSQEIAGTLGQRGGGS